MASCRKIAELFGGYIYGDLTPEEMREVRQHTSQCPKCANELKAQTAVVKLVPSQAPNLSDEDRQRIMWSVKGAIRSKEEKARPRFFVPVLAGSLAAAVLIIAAFGVGTVIGKRTKPAPEKVAVKPATTPSKVAVPDKEEPIDQKDTGNAVTIPPPPQIIAAGPQPLDRRTESFRGDKKHRKNRRERRVPNTAANEQGQGAKVPLAPDSNSPNNADLGKMGSVDDHQTGNNSNTSN